MTSWKQIKPTHIVLYFWLWASGMYIQQFFSETWDMFLSKKIPESENSYTTVRLQEWWTGWKKPDLANLAVDWRQLRTPRCRNTGFCQVWIILLICATDKDHYSQCHPSAHDITWLLSQVCNGGFLCQFIGRFLVLAFEQQPALTEITVQSFLVA